MNLNESELEASLRALRPALVAPAVERRIAADLGRGAWSVAARSPGPLHEPREPQRPFLAGWLQGLFWAGAGAAVVLAIAALRGGSSSLPPAPVVTAAAADKESLPPAVEATEILAATDEGLVYEEGGEPRRQVRYQSVERHLWNDAATGTWVEIAIPREDVRYTPVAMQ